VDISEDNDHELNQLGWWSHWAKLIWFSKQCYAFLSRVLSEPLFNHSEFLDPGAYGAELLPEIEVAFQREGLTPSFFVKDIEGYHIIGEKLRANGYRVIDQLSVMKMVSASFNGNAEVKPEVIGEDGIERWCETYLLSFYEENDLLVDVMEIAERALKDRRTKLILAIYDGVPAGTLALYETEKIGGVYCVGTLPRFRRSGVASTMLKFAYELSREDGKKLALQTFLTDSLERFYMERGFRRAYIKDVLVKSE